MALLTLTLLGTYEARTADNELLSFRSDKIRALLAYLALETGRVHRRESLATLLWPEWSDAEALHNLRNSLYRLRRALGPQVSNQLLAQDRQSVRLDESSLWLDAGRFQELLAICARHTGHSERAKCPDCIERLHEAVALYQGELLAGFSLPDALPFEEWLLLRRERFHQQTLAALYDLAAFHLQQEQYSLARQFAARQVAMEPWREAGQRQMMESLALSGRYEDALAQFDSCRRTLAKELGAEPSPETLALYRQIQDRHRAHRPDLLADSHQPQTADRPAYNLPRQFTRFVGRGLEIDHIAEQLADPACALLTILGPGGIGKTRLGIEAARKGMSLYPDGVWFVPLAQAQTVDEFPAALSAGLMLSASDSADIEQQVLDFLRNKQLLLLLDNFEHLTGPHQMGATEFLLTILQQAPQIKILVTSRERLRLQAEWVFEVGGLPAPPEGAANEMAETFPAVQLFIHRLRQIRPLALKEAEVNAIGRICRLVEGMPLAIELAAALTITRPFSEIAEAISSDLDILSSRLQDVPARQRSLRAVFDYSWQMLAPAEQTAMARLSIFPAGFAAPAAQAVANTTEVLLQTLVEKSFLRRSENGRLEMHTLMHQFAAEKLAATHDPAAVRALREQFSVYYLSYTTAQEAILAGADARPGLQAISCEMGNIRQAWLWAAEQAQVAILAQSRPALVNYCLIGGHAREGNRLLQAAVAGLEQVVDETDDATRRRKHLLSFLLAERLGFLVKLSLVEEGTAVAGQAVAYGRETDNKQAIIAAQQQLAAILWRAGRMVEAEQKIEQTAELLKGGDFPALEVRTWLQKGALNYYQGTYEQAQHNFEQALQRCREVGEQGHPLFRTYSNLGYIHMAQGNYETAREYCEQALAMYRQAGSLVGQCTIFSNLSKLLIRQHHYMQALDTARRGLDLAREIGESWRECTMLVSQGVIFMRLGQWETAGTLLRQALSLSRPIHNTLLESETQCYLTALANSQGKPEEALIHGEEALRLEKDRDCRASALLSLGRALDTLGRQDQAIAAFQEASTIHRDLGKLNPVAEVEAELAHLYWRQDRPEQAHTYLENILHYLEVSDEDPGGPGNVQTLSARQRLEGTEEPVQLYLTCYQVLQTLGDGRADHVLALGVRLLVETAGRLTDLALRRSFLEEVPAHRQIRQEWKAKWGTTALNVLEVV